MNIAVLGFKGGVGKTTTAVHLALYLQQGRGAPGLALLIDADPNRSASRWAERGSFFPIQVLARDPATPPGFQPTVSTGRPVPP